MASTNTTPQRAAPPVKPFDELACLRVRSEMLFWKLDPARSTVDDSAVAAATEQPPAASLFKRKFGSMRALSANSNKRRRHSTLRDATNSADAASNFEAPAPRLKLKTTPLSPSQGVGLAEPLSPRHRVPPTQRSLETPPPPKTIEREFRLLYSQRYCPVNAALRTFLSEHGLKPQTLRDAAKQPIDAAEALTLCRSVTTVIVAKKSKLVTVRTNRPNVSDEMLLQLVLSKEQDAEGRNMLKSPMMIVGSRMVIGYNEECLKHAVFFGNYDAHIATTVTVAPAPLLKRLSGTLRSRASPSVKPFSDLPPVWTTTASSSSRTPSTEGEQQ